VAWRSAQAEDQSVERELAAAFDRKLAPGERATGHALVQLKLDSLRCVLALIVKKNLWQLDLAAQKFLGEVGSVVGTILVSAEDRHATIETALAEPKRRRVACPTPTDDDNARRSH
jgi:hypothetical protein